MARFFRPSAKLSIQRVGRGLHPEGEAQTFEWPKLSMDARIASATSSEDGAVALLTADIPNIPRDVVLDLEPEGVVLMEMGYLDALGDPSSLPSVQPAFVGTLKEFYNVRNGAVNVLHVEASADAARLDSGYVPVGVGKPIKDLAAVKAFTIGEAIEALAAGAGCFAIIPPSAFGTDPRIPGNLDLVTFEDYSSQGSVREEIQFLVDMLNQQTGIRHVLSYDPSTAFTILITNELEDEFGILEVDLDHDTTYHASPMKLSRPPADLVDYAGTTLPESVEPDTPEDVDEGSALEGFTLTGPLDPRIFPGRKVLVKNYSPDKAFMVMERVHTIGANPQTESSGPTLDFDRITQNLIRVAA